MKKDQPRIRMSLTHSQIFLIRRALRDYACIGSKQGREADMAERLELILKMCQRPATPMEKQS